MEQSASRQTGSSGSRRCRDLGIVDRARRTQRIDAVARRLAERATATRRARGVAAAAAATPAAASRTSASSRSRLRSAAGHVTYGSRGSALLYWVVKGVLTPVLRACYRVRVEGREHLPTQGPVILAANHRSFLDSIFLPLVLRRRVTFVAKAEYFDDPKTAWFFRGVGQIPIRREGGSASERALASATEVLEGGGVFGIYPEGTRTRDGYLHRGHTGVARLALRTGAPIVPVGLIGTDEIQPTDKKLPRLFRTVDGPLRRADRRRALRATARDERLALRAAHRRGDVRDRAALGLRVRRHVRDEEGRGRPDRRRATSPTLRAARHASREPRRRQRRVRPVRGERSTARCHSPRADVATSSARHRRRERRLLGPRARRPRRARPTRPRRCPARYAAPSAVVSCTAGAAHRRRRAGRPGTGTAGPSRSRRRRRAARRARVPLAAVIASTTSRGLERHRLDDGAGEVRAAGAAREAEDRAARVRVPPRRAEAGERGHEHDAAGVGDALGERAGLGRVGDDRRARRAATGPRRRSRRSRPPSRTSSSSPSVPRDAW